jgi:hypothetical protein
VGYGGRAAPGADDAFGVIVTAFRELEWETPIFSRERSR